MFYQINVAQDSTEIMTGKLARDVPPNEPHPSVIYFWQHTGLWQVHSFVNIDFQGLQGKFSCDKGVRGREPATRRPSPC